MNVTKFVQYFCILFEFYQKKNIQELEVKITMGFSEITKENASKRVQKP